MALFFHQLSWISTRRSVCPVFESLVYRGSIFLWTPSFSVSSSFRYTPSCCIFHGFCAFFCFNQEKRAELFCGSSLWGSSGAQRSGQLDCGRAPFVGNAWVYGGDYVLFSLLPIGEKTILHFFSPQYHFFAFGKRNCDYISCCFFPY